MDKYYYMISQLPLLFYEKESFMTIEYFMGEAEKWLTTHDYRSLSRIDIDDTSLDRKGPRIWQKYKRFEFRFRNDLAIWRKSLRTDQGFKPSEFPLSLVKEGDPLDVEKKLLEHRWIYIENLGREHHFDLEFLILYLLKLQIMRRWSSFNKEKGMEIFKNVVTEGCESRGFEDGNGDSHGEGQES